MPNFHERTSAKRSALSDFALPGDGDGGDGDDDDDDDDDEEEEEEEEEPMCSFKAWNASSGIVEE